MLIKTISNRGDAIPYTPEESLPFAVEYGMRMKTDQKYVYWLVRQSIKLASIHFRKEALGSWEASANGTAMVGRTNIATDRFTTPKEYQFSIRYKPGKDNLGLPDIQVIEFDMTPTAAERTVPMDFVDQTLPPETPNDTMVSVKEIIEEFDVVKEAKEKAE